MFWKNKFCNFKIHLFSILNTIQTNHGIFSNKTGEKFNLAKSVLQCESLTLIKKFLLFFFQFACKTDLMIRSWKCTCPIKLSVYYWTRRYFKSSHQSCSLIKGVLRNFAKFTGNHLCQSLFLITPATLFKKRLWYRCILVNFGIFLRTPPDYYCTKVISRLLVLLISCINVKMELPAIHCKIV